jgi:SNF2 family DNA or RNA helicase
MLQSFVESVGLAPGQLVRCRSRRHLVEAVFDADTGDTDTLVRLSCIEDDALGMVTEVLWEREVDAEVLADAGWQHIGEHGFDAPGLFAAYLNAIRWNTVTATDPTLFQAPFRAGIEVMAYQLEPLRKALQLPRVNLFVADDVGLGKTIEAGLILRELMLRQRVNRVVVAAPPSVVSQWREELEQRFGLVFEVYDRAYVQRKRMERGHAINPWTTHSRFIISHALLADESYASGLRDWLGESAPGTLLILDEAHHAAPASGSKYAIDSQFTRTIRDLAGRFEHRLFLSATPHNGHSNSFAALLELLDPQRFTRGVPVKSAKELEPIMVRRLKEDLRQLQGGFALRKVERISVDGLPDDAPELVLARMLDDLDTMRTARLASARKSAQSAGRLTIIGLQKRLLSSVEAFARTAAVHLRTMERALDQESEPASHTASTTVTLNDLMPPGADDEGADSTEEELLRSEDDAMARATQAASLGSRDALQREVALIRAMVQIANAHRSAPDPRIRALVDWMRANQCPGLPSLDEMRRDDEPAQWLPRRAIIFTEYADTKRYLEQQLRQAIAGSELEDERILVYHGGMGEDARDTVKKAFTIDPAKHPVRILIATDAAREGLNLQAFCADLFHFDLPWNPARLEQRNGRIDRKGQPAAEVRCHYFVLEQRPEDRVLETLVEKSARIRTQLGSMAPVLERQVEQLLANGITRKGLDELTARIRDAEADPVRRQQMIEELEVARAKREDLEAQIDRLESLREKAESHLNFREPAFRAALDRALVLSGGQPMQETVERDRSLWQVPLPANDPAWQETLDTLRPPRDRKTMSIAEWRNRTSLRPVVFRDHGIPDPDTVHLHLEQRLVQRLLGRFTAQGLVQYDLARACVGHTEDSVPRVVLLGRLSLYGPLAGRLHDEIIAVAARWRPLSQRTGALEPFAEGGTGESKTLDLLDRTLPDGDGRQVPKEVMARLQESLQDDVMALRPHLEARADAVADEARKRLLERGEREARELERLIVERVSRIQAQMKESRQLEFDLDTQGLRQLQSERRHWELRLQALEGERLREPARIRESYSIRHIRVEPLGVVYLWPVTG